MEPTDAIDIDGFDRWLDELVQGIASPAPADASDLAQAVTWLHQRGQSIMISSSFDRQLSAQLRPASADGPDSQAPLVALPPAPPTASPRATPSPKHRALMAAAAVLIAIPLLILVIRSFGGGSEDPTIPAPTNGLAQAGTPVPCSIQQPTTLEISGTPEYEAVLNANAMSGVPNIPDINVPVQYEEDLPVGPPASATDLAEIQHTLATFASCLYAREGNADDFFSDDSFRRTGTNRGPVEVTITPDPTLAWIPTRTNPLDLLSAPVAPVIVWSNVLPDGRIGVLLEQHVSGYGLKQYFVMVRSERGWLIDEVVSVASQPNPSPEPSMITLVITAIDLEFEPSRIEITADEYVTLLVRNEGVARKTFVVPELDIREELPSGEEVSILINAPKGVYEFYSDVPGQQAAGMKGLIIVLPSS